ncbi:DUF4931 domain-containing protein [Lactobacillus sp. ESL0260]|uniref:DUF4931 domain-containing protein n=1 Tax=Lactobacillus sp. ESL0260 TaxID=2069347 RepID=UPI000EFABFC3|nr:DUF4931 domain-containing protein [Lactobacillus sp. ESL0260]RMC60039.1 DUF4931 domain-containing protein [Lactobacillus sp. ESL0260]
MENDPLVFDVNIAKEKPNSYHKVKNNSGCPFCDVAGLTHILKKQGGMIWLDNKYHTLHDTVQTVLIESNKHQGDITTYSLAYNRSLMRFSLSCFKQMNDSHKYRSVLWYKNYGENSGGSLAHPHMQIVGLEKLDGYKYIQPNNFEGISLFNKDGVEVNVSTHPIQGYIELDFNLLNENSIDEWSDWIQSGAKYMLKVLSKGRNNSYNLFFYPRFDRGISAKLILRYTASPYFVGYKLSQVDNKEKLVTEAENFKRFFESGSVLEKGFKI